MTTVNNRNVSLSPLNYGASRAIRNVALPPGKSEDPKQKGFLNRSRRMLVCWENKAENYLTFLHLACTQLLFAKLLVFG